MLSDEERAHYASLGVAAEMSAHLFDAEGRRVGRDLGERCITVKADQLRRIPEVVAIAGGQRKAAAIDAVLRSGLVTSLVTDTSAADYLMTAGRPGRRSTGLTRTDSLTEVRSGSGTVAAPTFIDDHYEHGGILRWRTSRSRWTSTGSRTRRA